MSLRYSGPNKCQSSTAPPFQRSEVWRNARHPAPGSGSQWMLLLRHRVANATGLMAQVAQKGDAY
ncbi:hypothetical protein DENIT_90327 [Pseudomonas veronii]|nr:hypothetical protein DENIT_90327 [Pseudomonas veronii]